MKGMEMMFANLIGMKPSEIKEAADKTMGLISAAAGDLADIKAGQVRLEEKLDLLLSEKGIMSNGRKQLTAGNTSDNNERVQF